tara:strand:+ start:4646 stop:5506 length:861 start_codon:yes stop_codon:yes gene_type:complete
MEFHPKYRKQLFIGQVIAAFVGASSASKARKEAAARAEEQSQKALERQKAARARVEEQKARYAQYQFQNPFEGMENPFEDLKVSTEAADFQMEQAAQQRANIMAGLRGAAGTSGIAGLAQALANQGVIQARQVSADIARQEAAGQLAMAKGAMAIDQLERQGQAAVQQAESAREATILGMEYGALTGASQAQQQASQNQMYQGIAGMQMQQQNMLALASLSGVDGPLSNLFGGMGGQQRVNVGVPLGLPSSAAAATGGLMGSLTQDPVLTQQITTPSYYNITDQNQ